MELLSLLTICSLGFDPKIMQGIAHVQSAGVPYAIKQGDDIAHFDEVRQAISAARNLQKTGTPVRIGLMGANIDLLSASAEPNEGMFEPCINVNIASRALKGFEKLCEARGENSPELCAVASYLGGGYDSQDLTHVDFIFAGAELGTFDNPNISAPAKVKYITVKEKPVDAGPIFFGDVEQDDVDSRPIVDSNDEDQADSLFFK